ncbi:fasciclin domain-containing protein [Leucothrix arctica]|uniref:FAS1 domain-containing protein n=1 Tax=Leucothrix arctica TaxID=1481894 RepID=A0A317C457_9GAMM|nr:fasciclin domain-containing protein [Leucothrix arctica]PWQ93368.1 hypothetical protein DKT75_17170 [Leucothrix arctica]
MKVGIITGILSAAMLVGVGSVQAGSHSAGEEKAGMHAEMKADIIDTAVAAGSFKTLATALEAADLIDALKAEGPFTVFAPTDEAFAKIPEETLNAILADKERLTAILTYHVISGSVPAKDVAGLKSAKTLSGAEVMIDTSDGVKINDATVIKADIMTSNGIIHVIDTVLLPPAE